MQIHNFHVNFLQIIHVLLPTQTLTLTQTVYTRMQYFYKSSIIFLLFGIKK